MTLLEEFSFGHLLLNFETLGKCLFNGDMITVYLKESAAPSGDESVLKELSGEELSNIPLDSILWIDVMHPDLQEKETVERIVGMKIPSRSQAEEIESTSKYSETKDSIIANTNYFINKGHTFHIDPVSFIIGNNTILVSSHHIPIDSFHDAEERLKINPGNSIDGFHHFLTILEAKIDHDADMEELVAREISALSQKISSAKKVTKDVIHSINDLQEKTMSLRENIFDLQRVLSGVLRSHRFPPEAKPRLELMLKDVDSLVNHGDISFQRLDYLQDTAMGLINIEQNEIVKILSVAAVIFMPPTLIASIYGMNFKVMPELDWVWQLSNGWVIPAGYLFALGLMLLVTWFTYWYFRYKKWL